MKRIVLLSLLAALPATALAPAAAAKVTLSWATGPTVKVLGAQTPDREYDAEAILWISKCRGDATPLMAGWSGGRTPVSIVYSHLIVSDKQIAVALRKPFRTAKVRGRALCASGVRVTTKESHAVNESASGRQRVACKRSQLAIGAPIDSGPYWSEAVASKPDGLRAWTTTEPGYARAKVVCVPASAFKAVKLVHKRATFKAGKATATVTAKCRDGRRPISWGFEAGTLADNVWTSVESYGLTMKVPFIAAAKPSGKAGWSLTFATPDGAAAKSPTKLALHLTCAKPR